MKFIKRIFCFHFKWKQTGEKITGLIGVSIEWECKKCGKKMYRDLFNPPIDFID